jgi:hypothetical protein
MTVSLLVPFTPEKGEAGRTRVQNWKWLERRWQVLLPEAEIVVGENHDTPFSKSRAVNDAYSKASGEVFVIADADSWCEPDQVLRAVGYAQSRGVLVVPWVNAYRLTKRHSKQILEMDPATPYPVSQEMRREIEDFTPSPSTAAMVVVIMREDFERVGGFDPRMAGWGAEDVSFGLACTTLVGRTKILMGESFALWHERPRDSQTRRIWEGDKGEHNMALGQAYWDALGKVHAMTALCMAHPLEGSQTLVGRGPNAGETAPLYVKQFQDAQDGVTVTGGSYKLYGGTKEGEHIAL